MQMHYVVPLGSEEFNVSQIGEKAQSLRHLAKFGIHTLDGFVITTTAFLEFIKANHITNNIANLTQLDTSVLANVSASTNLRKAILNLPIPANILESIQVALDHLKVLNLIVRSSAPQEDGINTSFAGMHDTVLNVPSQLNECVAAIRQCWASTFSERAISYRRVKNNVADWEMAVLIQEMACTSWAGTVLTHFPQNNQLLIEVVPGLGSTLASGFVSPDSFLIYVPTMDIISASIPTKTIQSVCKPFGGVQDCSINITSPLLPVNTLRSISELALRISNIKGSPQLIEWGIRNGEIIVFQSRPAISNSLPPSKFQLELMSKLKYKRKLTGIVASPGYACGIAKTLDDTDGYALFQDGEIVVGKHFIPEMVESFENVVAIVAETGGLTSHAAVIARELNIPAIVSVTNALQHISTGSKIFVDGEAGFVGLLVKTKRSKKAISNTKTKYLLYNNDKLDVEDQCPLAFSFDALSSIDLIIKTGRIVLSKTGALVVATSEFDIKWKKALLDNDLESIKSSWGQSIGRLLVSVSAFLNNPSHSTFNELYHQFIDFYIYNLIAEAYPIEQSLWSIINSYVKPKIKPDLLAAALDISNTQNIPFTQLSMQLLLPLPDTYVSLIRVASNRPSRVQVLRSAFNRMTSAYKSNPNDFLSLTEALITGNFPVRIAHPSSLTVHAIAAYRTIMSPHDFALLSRCLKLVNMFTVFNDVNRFLPLAYADDLDIVFKKILPQYERKEEWPWNQLLQIHQTSKYVLK
jgi:pyruvate,water dikinase